MTLKTFIKYNVMKKKKRIVTEDYFCNKLRNNEQYKLISKIKELKVDVSKLNLNWNFISLNDNLTIPFISYFKDYINFHDLSLNKNLTSKHLNKFKKVLEWDILSEHYNFTLDDLHIYKKYINWKFIFFYKNIPSEIIKEDFYQKMWWLFLDDQIYNENDLEYIKYNNMIMNKNMNTIPKQLIDRFEYTLLEYKRNKIVLKNLLKIQLNELYKEFINNRKIVDLKRIDCNNFLVEHKDQGIQNENKLKIKINCSQTTQTNNNSVNSLSTQTQKSIEEKSTQTEDILECSLQSSISIESKEVEDRCKNEMQNIQDDILTDIIEDIIEDIVIEI
jgi:hypothetical protein